MTETDRIAGVGLSDPALPTRAVVPVSYTASSKLRTIESVTANEMASCDWLTAPALLNTSYWSVIYRDKNPSRLPAGRSNIIAIYYH